MGTTPGAGRRCPIYLVLKNLASMEHNIVFQTFWYTF